jgi:pseudouridine kinase
MGTDVIEKLKRHKVNTRYIRKVPDGMGTWLAIFDNDGDVAGSISKRPNLEPIAQILKEEGDEIIKDCDSIVVEFDLENSVLKQVFALAEKYHKDVYAAVSNMSIAMKRRDRLQKIRCFVCNKEEAEVFFSDSFSGIPSDELARVLVEKIRSANIRSMIVTLGGDGAIYADALTGEYGQTHAMKVNVSDTTGAGDAFFSGVAIGLTYGKSLAESCEIGTRLAASVIVTQDNVCPRFRPEEFGLMVKNSSVEL